MKRFVLGLFFCFQLSILMASSRPRRSHAHHPTKAHHSVLFLMGHNSFQVESYFNFENNAGVVTMSHPSLLFRYGLRSVVEFRLNLDLSSVSDLHSGINKTGFMPLQPGLKFLINQPKKYLPAFSFTTSVVIPKAANSNMRQTYFAPSLLFSAEQDLAPKLSFEYVTGVQWDADDFHRIYQGSVNFEYDPTERSTFYGDVYLFKDEYNPVDMRADVGFNQTISPGLQFDLSAGAGFTNNSPEFFLSTGFIFSAKARRKVSAVRAGGVRAPLPKRTLY